MVCLSRACFGNPSIGRFIGVDPLADKYPGWNPYHYVHNNPVRLTDPSGMEADDDYVINNKGIVTNIIRTDKPDRIIMEDGTNIPFNDPSQDRTELKNYKKGDQLVQFIDKRKLEFIMKKVGAGSGEGNIVSNSFNKFDFAYSTLSKDYPNEYYKENTDGRRGSRSKYIEIGGFYVSNESNKYKDARKAYNIHDAGNFLWGNANRRESHSLKTLLWGANLNELLNFRWGDSVEDMKAIISGYYHK